MGPQGLSPVARSQSGGRPAAPSSSPQGLSGSSAPATMTNLGHLAKHRPAMADPLILIPARLGAPRLPNKPLADIAGEAMIVHVWRRAVEAGIGPVAVATDSAEIAAAVRAAGGLAVMTRSDHASGSDRIAEAMESFDPEGRHDIVVNVQGD